MTSFKVGDKVKRHPDFYCEWWLSKCLWNNVDPYGVFTIDRIGHTAVRLVEMPRAWDKYKFQQALSLSQISLEDFL